jgi:hypothetical protein
MGEASGCRVAANLRILGSTGAVVVAASRFEQAKVNNATAITNNTQAFFISSSIEKNLCRHIDRTGIFTV